MKTNKDLKNAALAALKGHWGPAVIASLVMMVIGMAVSFSAESKSVIVILLRLAVTVLVSLPLSVGFYASYRKLYVDGDIKVTENMFGIAFGNWAHNLGGMLLMGVYTCLWSLLLIIPGIIKTFAYALTPFILNEKSELSANEAIELSTKMMDGHKMELFLLYLSFVGWALLGILTLGIGYLWLIPYMYTTVAAFYEEIKAEYEANNATVIEAPQESAL